MLSPLKHVLFGYKFYCRQLLVLQALYPQKFSEWALVKKIKIKNSKLEINSSHNEILIESKS